MVNYRRLFPSLIFLAIIIFTEANARTISQKEVEGIIEMYADINLQSREIAKHICLPINEKLYNSYIEKRNNDVNDYNKGFFGMVIGSSYINAGYFAYCYSQEKGQVSMGEISEIVGNFIALNVIVTNKISGILENNRWKHSVALLKYAHESGLEKSSLLEKLESINQQDKGTPVVSEKNVVKTTALELVAQLGTNQSRFAKMYKEKLIEVTGKVSRINETHDQDINITLLGTSKDINDQRWMDNIDCIIPKGSASFAEATEINMGQKVTIMGLFKDFGLMGQIELSNSSIVNKK